MVNAIQQFLAAISANVEHDKNYWENVRKASVVLEKANAADLDRLFQQINERQSTEQGSLIFVLGAKIKKMPNDQQALINLLAQCNLVAISMLPDDMDHVQDKFSQVMTALSQYLIDQNIAIHGITILQQAIWTLSRGQRGVLTNLHARLFCLCLAAKRFDSARLFLDLNAANCFLNVNNLYKVSCENALLYFYYGGLIKLALKDFEGAALMFESCVCMPAISASAIMLESLKKLIMLNLILGRSGQLPAYRAAPIQRLAQIKCQKYQALAQMYASLVENRYASRTTLIKFKRHLEKLTGELEKDHNTGLAQEVYLSATRNNIAKLPDVFSKLQIAKVAKYCRIDDEHVCIQYELERFLQDHHIEGKIDAREGTVSFQPAERNTELDEQRLDEATNTCVALDELLRRSQRIVDLHPAILSRQIKKHH